MDKTKKSNSSLDTVILLSDNEENPSKRRKCQREHRKDKTLSEKPRITKTKYPKDPSINISQQIQVDNKEFQCVINLNTNVYKHKSRCREKSGRKPRSRHLEESKMENNNNIESKDKEHKNKDKQQSKSYSIKRTNYRTVPACHRKSCWDKYERQKDYSRRKQITEEHRMYQWQLRKEMIHKKSRDEIKREEHKDVNKHHKHATLYCKESKNQIKQTESRILLSPISSTPLEDVKDSISYDEISGESLEVTNIVVQQPSHRKHKQHKFKRATHESKLDTLIKRTKERERKLVEKSRNWLTSTPVGEEFSSGDFPMTCSDMDVSINSASTVVLNSRAPYTSHEIEKCNSSRETVKLNYQPYSPGSPMKEVNMFNEEIDYKWFIKEPYGTFLEGPTMKIEAYSPTHNPESKPKSYQCTSGTQEINIKTEPLFPSELSPIYNEDNSKLMLVDKICKIENVKPEPVFD